ncbi:Protein of unknown function [Bacillus toyonensis]|nr:Protein of unknown function [Bacillus toyonensis]
MVVVMEIFHDTQD